MKIPGIYRENREIHLKGNMDLLIGLGNPTRQDDGAGWDVIQRLEAMKLPDVETRVLQQLGLEILEEWNAYGRILLIDAEKGAGEAKLERVHSADIPTSTSTHHVKPEDLLHLSVNLYGKGPELYLCRVPGGQFDFGIKLSSQALQSVESAVHLVEKWLKE
jgi:hydrogenase maturation protease